MLPWEPRGLSGSLSQAVTPTPSLPSPSRPVAPTLAPLSTGGPDLSPLPALATPTCGLCQPQTQPQLQITPTTPARPPPPPTLAGRTPAISQPLLQLPGPCLGSLSRPSRAWHRVSTGHKGAEQTGRQAGAKRRPGPRPQLPALSTPTPPAGSCLWSGGAPLPPTPTPHSVRVDRTTADSEAVNASSKQAP